MNWLDAVILISGGVLAVVGLKMGALHIAAIAVGSLAGLALASRLQSRVAPLFENFTDSENGPEMIALVVIFLLAMIAVFLVGSMLKGAFDKVSLGWVDKVAGVGVGVIIAFAIGSAILSSIQDYPVFGIDDTIEASALGTFLADNFDIVLRGLRVVPTDLGA